MVFVLQVGAVLAAGVFAALAWDSRPLAAGAGRSLVVIACALSYIVFWSHLSQNVDGFRSERVQWRATPPEQAAIAGAAAAESGLQSSFAEWIRARIGPDSRFYLVPSPTQDVAVYRVVHVPAAAEHGDRRAAEGRLAGLLRGHAGQVGPRRRGQRRAPSVCDRLLDRKGAACGLMRGQWWPTRCSRSRATAC